MTSLNQRIVSLENGGTGASTIVVVDNLQTTLDTKQDVLTAGTNISIVDNVISSSGGGDVSQEDLDTKQDVLTAGTNISIVDNVISASGGGDVSQADLATKQDVLTAGDNISIVDNVISSSGGGGGGDPVSGKMIYVVRNSYHTIPDVFSYDSEFTTLIRNNSALFTFSNNNRITVLRAGLYKVEYNNSFRSRYYNDRANIRTVVTINGVVDLTLGGQNSCYARNRAFAAYATNSGAFIFSLNANDYIQLNNTVFKASVTGGELFDNSNPDFSMFDEDYRISRNSNFNAIQLLEGSNMLVTLLD